MKDCGASTEVLLHAGCMVGQRQVHSWLPLDEEVENRLDDPLGIGRREKGRPASGFGWHELMVSTAGGGASWEESKWNDDGNIDGTVTGQ